MTDNAIIQGNATNPAYCVRIVCEGDRYGLDNCLRHSGNPMVEFYDTRYSFTPYGQFVSRYYVDTLKHDRNALERWGLDLDGGVPDWKVSPDAMREVFHFLAARFPMTDNATR